MADMTALRARNALVYTLQAAIGAGEALHLRDGRVGYYNKTVGAALGDKPTFETEGQVTAPKSTSTSLLDGGPAYWDWTNNRLNFRKTLNSKDFFAGTVVGDAAQSDATATINLNLPPVYDLDLLTDPYGYLQVMVGTQSLNVMGVFPRGGMNTMILSSTNEAQKMDMLSVHSMPFGSRGIVRGKINVITTGAGGAQDFNLGLASGTNATDFDSVTQALVLHLNGNSTQIRFSSRDGTSTPVAEADSTLTYTAGTPFEVWLDLRDPTSCKIYVDGVRVCASSVFNVNGAGSAWKLIAHLEKTAAADVYEVACNAALQVADQSVLSV